MNDIDPEAYLSYVFVSARQSHLDAEILAQCIGAMMGAG